MDVEIVEKRENPLLKRTEVRFRVVHPKEKTPARQSVRDKLAAVVGSPRDGVIIAYMRSHFGVSSSEGFAKCYGSAEEAKKMEPAFLLRRHGLAEAKKEAPVAEKKEAKPAEKKEAKPAEKKEPAPVEKKEAPHAEKKEAKPAEKKEAAPAHKEAKPAEKKEAAHAEKKEAKPAEKK